MLASRLSHLTQLQTPVHADQHSILHLTTSARTVPPTALLVQTLQVNAQVAARHSV